MYILDAIMSYGAVGGIVVLLLGTQGIKWVANTWSKGKSAMTKTITEQELTNDYGL